MVRHNSDARGDDAFSSCSRQTYTYVENHGTVRRYPSGGPIAPTDEEVSTHAIPRAYRATDTTEQRSFKFYVSIVLNRKLILSN